VNRNGHIDSLTPFAKENTAAAKHRVWSERLRETRADEIVGAIMDAPHTIALDVIGARQIARLEALIEAC
jgi:hypothetical protein